MSKPGKSGAVKGRGAVGNQAGRFARDEREAIDDGWPGDDEDTEASAPATVVRPDPARRLISRNQSPDIPFDASINPYRGCEHGCPFCFARPSHSYLDLSPGLDFETRIFYKDNAAAILEAELRKPGYRPTPISLGINTDAYQPVERRLRVTRDILEVLQAYRHPVSLITKSRLILRDLDILEAMGAENLVSVAITLTTLDSGLKRILEPRTASPAARLDTIRQLSTARVPTAVMAAPVIPAITDHEMEAVLRAAAEHGAHGAGYVLLRLPWEVKQIFRDWLAAHFPDRAAHVMSLIQQSRGGRDYDAAWGQRLTGTGKFAELIAQRFTLACRKHGLNRGARPALSTKHFRLPPRTGDQLSLL
ncbi:PA0069 family radical SAM protein [Spectribacter hydrogenoxidans]|uniref:PA0069 family radical SAM protein n=1 Tax=Spectribacter hydrogenoxidans TaxID=3075608 RepID=A0ABU3BWR8_9GAMM|nr:PA0069 family radical SAM protein [Salinisphaera sp. W335]MDT0633727.1 PA0069 family radical SAM protein [Salinisphaera sp. W335]